MSLQRTQRETTSREFVKWRRYLRQDLNRRDKIDWYLAQIATEVRRTNLKDPRKVKTEDLLITFELKNKKGKRISRKEAAARSKAVWFGALGLDKDGNPKPGYKRRKPPPRKV